MPKNNKNKKSVFKISKYKRHNYNILNDINKNISQQQNNNSVKMEDNPNESMNDEGKNEEMEIDSDVKQSSQTSLVINKKENGKKIYHIGNISFSNTENSYGDNFSTSNNSNIENEKKSINNSIKTIEYSEDAKKSEADKTIEMSEENEEDLNNKLILTCEYEYIDEILENLKLEEESNIYKINPNYFKYQAQINYNMRLILIDWLFEVYKKLRFKEETFFTTIYIIDAYLSKKFVTKKNLQLLGVTALLIATKLNEISAGRVKDYVFITDKAYDEDDIIYMESNISRTFKFNFLVPTCLSFFEIISKKLQFDKDSNKINLGIFIIQCFLMNTKSLNYNYSIIAYATCYLLMKIFNNINLINNMNYDLFLGDNFIYIKDCTETIGKAINEIINSNINLSIKKYYQDNFDENVRNLITKYYKI